MILSNVHDSVQHRMHVACCHGYHACAYNQPHYTCVRITTTVGRYPGGGGDGMSITLFARGINTLHVPQIPYLPTYTITLRYPYRTQSVKQGEAPLKKKNESVQHDGKYMHTWIREWDSECVSPISWWDSVAVGKWHARWSDTYLT